MPFRWMLIHHISNLLCYIIVYYFWEKKKKKKSNGYVIIWGPQYAFDLRNLVLSMKSMGACKLQNIAFGLCQ